MFGWAVRMWHRRRLYLSSTRSVNRIVKLTEPTIAPMTTPALDPPPPVLGIDGGEGEADGGGGEGEADGGVEGEADRGGGEGDAEGGGGDGEPEGGGAGKAEGGGGRGGGGDGEPEGGGAGEPDGGGGGYEAGGSAGGDGDGSIMHLSLRASCSLFCFPS